MRVTGCFLSAILVFVLSQSVLASFFTPKNKKSEEKSYYLVGDNLMPLFAGGADVPKIIAKANGEKLIQMSPSEVHAFSHRIHETHHSCGGFIEVDKEVREAGGVKEFAASNFGRLENMAPAPFDLDQIRFKAADQMVISKVKEERYQTTLNQLTQFPDRNSKTENGKRAALWLRDRALADARAAGRNDVTAELVPTGRRYTQDSVVIRIQGGNGMPLPGVLIGGHMDTFENNKPGADDDGSGTIAVLEIFRAILDSGIRFQRDIYFVFYAAEEVGLVGSSRVAEQFKNEGTALRSVLQFDMTGYRSPKDDKDFYFVDDNVNAKATTFAKKIVTEVLDIPADKIGNTSCNYACSDHASWHRRGYAAVFPFEASFNNYNRNIHTGRDTMSILDMDHAIKFVKFGAAFVTEQAEPINL